MMREAIYGQDIKLGDDGQAIVAANGQLVLTEGIETVLQDIRLRFMTPLGSLFYAKNYGSDLINFNRDENTPNNRRALVAEVSRTIGEEPRVIPGSVRSKIISWDEKEVVLQAHFSLIEETHPFNLVITIGESIKAVIEDVDPY